MRLPPHFLKFWCSCWRMRIWRGDVCKRQAHLRLDLDELLEEEGDDLVLVLGKGRVKGVDLLLRRRVNLRLGRAAVSGVLYQHTQPSKGQSARTNLLRFLLVIAVLLALVRLHLLRRLRPGVLNPGSAVCASRSGERQHNQLVAQSRAFCTIFCASRSASSSAEMPWELAITFFDVSGSGRRGRRSLRARSNARICPIAR
jgi:hypothetical protein